MRRRPLVVAFYLGLAALLGIGSILTLAWSEAGIDRRARFLYRLENGRCYRVRYVMNGALARRSQNSISASLVVIGVIPML